MKTWACSKAFSTCCGPECECQYKWLSIFETSLEATHCFRGWYNNNYLLNVPDGERVVIRVPLGAQDDLEPRSLNEATVLRAAKYVGVNVPRVIWDSADPRFQVHEFIDGAVVNDSFPRGQALPPEMGGCIIEAMALLSEIPPELLGLDENVRTTTSGQQFFHGLIEREQMIYRRCRTSMPTIFEWLAVPDEPFRDLRRLSSEIVNRDSQLCHGDIERRNCIYSDGRLFLLDWELASWADPLWDLSVHLVRTQYLPREEKRLLQFAAAHLPGSATRGMERDLLLFRRYEALRALVNDSYRYIEGLASGSTRQTASALAIELEWKYALAADFMPSRTPSASEIEEVLTSEALKRARSRQV